MSYCHLPDGKFNIRIDLVQLMRVPGAEVTPDGCVEYMQDPEGDPGECGECFAASPDTTGPDVNFDGAVDESDVIFILGAFAGGTAGGDYNGRCRGCRAVRQ